MTVTPAKSIIYMTLGIPGAGKTFFARQFAAKNNLPSISADRLRFELFEQPEFSREEDATILNVMDYMLEGYLQAGLSVVVDGLNGQRVRRYNLRELARKHNSYPLIVWVQTDRDTAFDRASNRDRRSTDDKYTQSIDEETFMRQEAVVKKPQSEDYVVISGKHVFANQQNAVTNKVASIIRTIATAQLKPKKEVTLGGRVDMGRRKPRIR